MCSVVTEPGRIIKEKLKPIVHDFEKSFLVEAFNRILIDEQIPQNFTRGLISFVPKGDLEPLLCPSFLGIMQCMHF